MMKQIPNLITLGNLLCGCLAVVACFSDNLLMASVFILLAAVLDFMDGAAARLLHAYSDIGKDLDSLADLVSFGLVPACIAFRYTLVQVDALPTPYLAHGVFMMTLASAWRLAKFNHDTRQTLGFRGVPTPANAMFWAGLPLMIRQYPYSPLWEQIFHPYTILSVCALMSLLMISDWPMLSFKFKNFDWHSNWPRYVLLGLVVVAFTCFGALVIPLAIWFYVIWSFVIPRRFVVENSGGL